MSLRFQASIFSADDIPVKKIMHTINAANNNFFMNKSPLNYIYICRLKLYWSAIFYSIEIGIEEEKKYPLRINEGVKNKIYTFSFVP